MFKNVASLHPRTADLSGQRFGRLRVVGFDGYHPVGGYSSARWWVKCDCGVEKSVQARFLKNGLTQSCGCLQRERAGEVNRKPDGVAGFNRILRSYRSGATKRGYSWGLSREQAMALLVGSCHYCGQPPSQTSASAYTRSDRDTSQYSVFTHSGIDRVDNAVGYEAGNCVSCCETCNYAKRGMGHDDFVAWIDRAHRHLTSRGEVQHL